MRIAMISTTSPPASTTTMTDAGQWRLSDLKNLIECATAADGHVIDTLRNIVKLMEEEQSTNFILGKVIIENDMLDDDDDEEGDD